MRDNEENQEDHQEKSRTGRGRERVTERKRKRMSMERSGEGEGSKGGRLHQKAGNEEECSTGKGSSTKRATSKYGSHTFSTLPHLGPRNWGRASSKGENTSVGLRVS